MQEGAQGRGTGRMGGKNHAGEKGKDHLRWTAHHPSPRAQAAVRALEVQEERRQQTERYGVPAHMELHRTPPPATPTEQTINELRMEEGRRGKEVGKGRGREDTERAQPSGQAGEGEGRGQGRGDKGNGGGGWAGGYKGAPIYGGAEAPRGGWGWRWRGPPNTVEPPPPPPRPTRAHMGPCPSRNLGWCRQRRPCTLPHPTRARPK